jgi:hypothetical protein
LLTKTAAPTAQHLPQNPRLLEDKSMATNQFNNIPNSSVPNSSRVTLRAFDAYFDTPFELSAVNFDAIKGFFTSRGFDESSSESITVIIMKQAKIDGYNPMTILDTLKGLDSVEISALVSEIVNFNRFKTSFLGYALEFTPYQEVVRNVIA